MTTPRRAPSPLSVDLFGLCVGSELPLRTHLRSATGPPDLWLRLGEDCGEEPWPGATRYVSSRRSSNGSPALRIAEQDGMLALEFPGTARFVLAGDEVRLEPAPGVARDLLEARLLGTVLSLVLEQRGVLALHASAVEVAGRAVGFLATKRSGKTWLAAAGVRSSRPLVSDDVLPVEAAGGIFIARSGPPEMRLTAQDARLFGADPTGLTPVLEGLPKLRVPVGAGAWGEAHAGPLPLRTLYLPRRQEGLQAPRVVPASPGEALRALVTCSFSARLVEALGWQARRLEVLSRLVREVPVRVLEMPPGSEHLEATVERVAADAEGHP